MKEKVLITGASGLLGATLGEHLKNNYSVIEHSFTKKSEFQCDLSVLEEAKKFLIKNKPDVIVNLTAHTDVDDCEKNLSKCFSLNVKTVENIVESIGGTHCHLVHISTDMVYGGEGPHSEGSVNPINFYGYSKKLSEEIAMRVNSTVLRTNFFGKSKNEARKSFSDWIFSNYKNNNKIKLLEDVFFSPLHLSTLSEMIEVVIQKKTKGVFNLGSRDGCSKLEFALSMSELLGFSKLDYEKAKLSELNLYAKRPLDMRMDSTLFEMTFQKLPSLSDDIKKLRGEYA